MNLSGIVLFMHSFLCMQVRIVQWPLVCKSYCGHCHAYFSNQSNGTFVSSYNLPLMFVYLYFRRREIRWWTKPAMLPSLLKKTCSRSKICILKFAINVLPDDWLQLLRKIHWCLCSMIDMFDFDRKISCAGRWASEIYSTGCCWCSQECNWHEQVKASMMMDRRFSITF